MDDDDDKLTKLVDKIRDFIADKAQTTSRVRAIGDAIQTLVNDPCLAPSCIRKVARAASKSEDRLDELCLLLARFGLKNDRKEIESPAAFFGTSAKRLVINKWGEPWDETRAKR